MAFASPRNIAALSGHISISPIHSRQKVAKTDFFPKRATTNFWSTDARRSHARLVRRVSDPLLSKLDSGPKDPVGLVPLPIFFVIFEQKYKQWTDEI